MAGADGAATATFTVDVEGDWAGSETRGIREALPRLVDLLGAYGATATFFVVAELVDLVTAVLPADGPHEVGSHGLTHRPLTRLGADEVQHEVVESKRRLEEAGYTVHGFRAPYFARPAGLGRLLADAGYRYDASFGSLHPMRRPRVPAGEPLPVVTAGTLRDGRTPFALTYLRLTHPLGVRLVGPDPGTFWCHPHELVDHTAGWTSLPPGLRHLHRRASGKPAWNMVERLLARPDLRFTSLAARS
jgi:peptidoglycan/xylan/chitin deacetylase (PgdA/CDA1 family)